MIFFSHVYILDIVHRDLKLENILLTTNPEKPDDNTFVKIVDFGLSTVLSKRSHKAMLSGVVGTSVYMRKFIF